MNWMDEGALYSQIADMLREDLGRGDITSQAIVERNTRARGRFVANEKMVVAGLEAAEEVFLTLDSQQQLEAFVGDGEEIEAGREPVAEHRGEGRAAGTVRQNPRVRLARMIGEDPLLECVHERVELGTVTRRRLGSITRPLCSIGPASLCSLMRSMRRRIALRRL